MLQLIERIAFTVYIFFSRHEENFLETNDGRVQIILVVSGGYFFINHLHFFLHQISIKKIWCESNFSCIKLIQTLKFETVLKIKVPFLKVSV